MQIVKQENGRLKTTSKIIADVFGKSHKNVIRAINNIDCSNDFRVRNFERSFYISPQNKKLHCFDITRDGFALLCMGFTGAKAAEWKERYINAFNEMENGLLNIDKRMNDLILEKTDIKKAGAKWSAIGREIRSVKKIHMIKADQLLNDVQMKLDY